MNTVLTGSSSWTEQLRANVRRVAPHDASVLITGPSGSGKGVIARQIHEMSHRAEEPFVSVDCTTIVGSLFYSQLFGHVRGAFTGAECQTLGCFRAAEGGTVFLDEVGELEPSIQSKLLKVLQERQVTPLGTDKAIPINVRVIAATNRDLEADAQSGRFRQDLFYRLNVVHLEAIPLCHRPDDIDQLADHVLQQLADRQGLPRKALSAGAIELLRAMPWPGNVRQLEHAMEQAAIFCDGPVIDLRLVRDLLERGSAPSVASESHYDLPEEEPSAAWHSPSEDDTSPSRLSGESAWKTLEHLEREHIRSTMELTGNNQSKAARMLGISRQTLIRKIKKNNLLPVSS
jgi:DNA-binding NtrC family response regulator